MIPANETPRYPHAEEYADIEAAWGEPEIVAQNPASEPFAFDSLAVAATEYVAAEVRVEPFWKALLGAIGVFIAAFGLCAWAAMANEIEPNAGYYRGLATLYPYGSVYCPNAWPPEGQCYGRPGDLVFLPKSAPLPEGSAECVWHGSTTDLMDGWYKWEPRTVPDDEQKSVGKALCFLADRGEPRNINDLHKNTR